MPTTACGTTINLTQNIGSSVCVRPGGVNKRAWVFNLSDIVARTFDSTSKNLSGLTIASGKKGYTATGRKEKNTAGADFVPGDAGLVFNHKVILKFFHDTQLERLAVTEFAKSEELVVFMEGNDNTIEVYGLYKGLNTTQGSYSRGLLASDENSITVQKEGQENDLPWFYRSGTSSTHDADVAALNAMLVAAS